MSLDDLVEDDVVDPGPLERVALGRARISRIVSTTDIAIGT